MSAAEDLRRAVDGLMRAVSDRDAQREQDNREQIRVHDRLLRDLFEVADGIERSLASADSEARGAIEAIQRQLEEVLADQDVVSFRPATGVRPDLRLVEVMATVPAVTNGAGRVTRVLRAGYQTGDRVIRRAGVEMSKE